MALIFFLSAQPDLGTGLGVADLVGRKFVHAGVYAALTLLWWWAFTGGGLDRSDRPGGVGGPEGAGGRGVALAPVIFAAIISFLYAVSDEYHQTFTDGRSGSPVDVAIDTVGIAFACWLVVSGHATRITTKVASRVSGFISR